MDQEALRKTIHGNLQAYMNNNAARLELWRQHGPSGARSVFSHIPLLLQFNHSEFPGYIHNDSVPVGIHGFDPAKFATQAPQVFPDIARITASAKPGEMPAIQSIFLMGSVGTVAYNTSSDLDYWICLDDANLSDANIKLLINKLSSITAWAKTTFSTEANFYLISLSDLAANYLPNQGRETEGEVAPLIVKGELYRTLLWVAGKVPLWWLVPSGATRQDYYQLDKRLQQDPSLRPSGLEFIDLGYPARPSAREYASAALWLCEKSWSDPSKAVLKMMLILEQVESGLTATRLSDLVKESIFSAQDQDYPVDPYAMTITRVLDYAASALDPQMQELVRLSAFFKVRGMLGPAQAALNPYQRRFLDELLEKWPWDERKIKWVSSYASWHVQDRLSLGQDQKTLIYNLYSRIYQRLRTDFPVEVATEDKRLTQFKADFLARSSDNRLKVEELPSTQHRKSISNVLSLIRHQSSWQLFDGQVEAWQVGAEEHSRRLLAVFSRAARAAAFLVNNRLFKPDLKVRILPRPGSVSIEAMTELMKKIEMLFPLIDYREVESQGGWKTGALGPRLLVVNFEEPWTETRIGNSDLIYRTAWGEMRHVHQTLGRENTEVDKLLFLANQLKDTGKLDPGDVHFFFPQTAMGRRMERNLRTILTQTLSGVKKPGMGTGERQTKTLLDRE